MGSSTFFTQPFLDQNGFPAANTPFGDAIIVQRRDQVTANFVYGFPYQTFSKILQFSSSSFSSSFNQNETIVGLSSNAIGILDLNSPMQVRCLHGIFTSGEFIKGIGITASQSLATASITFSPSANGQIVTSRSIAIIEAGTLAPCSIALESKHLATYNAGHELGAFFTSAVPSASNDPTCIMGTGLYTQKGTNGYGVGYSGSNFGTFAVKNNVITFDQIGSWNIDNLDGLGPSGLSMPNVGNNINIWNIKTGYLGTYGALFSVIGTDRRLWPVHYVTKIDSNHELVVDDPHFVIRSFVTKNSGSETPEVWTGSWNVYTAGPDRDNAAPKRINDYVAAAQSIASGPENLLFILLNKITFANVRNNLPVRLISVSFSTDATATKGAVIRLRRNSPVSGSSFTDIDSVDSCCSVSSVGGGQSFGGTVFSAQVGFGVNVQYVDLTNEQIFITPGEHITVTCETNSTQLIRVSLRWLEFH
jgi:hypothetical protein